MRETMRHMSENSHDAGHDSTAAPMSPSIPDRPSLDGLESKWDTCWENAKVYAFNRDTGREKVFSIDTPPPTASGSLHIGHVFAYTQADILARYNRMIGKDVFYPMGWDDNGLPTERGGNAKTAKPQNQMPISRKNFIDLCLELTTEDEKAFEHTFRTLGLSVDWNLRYQTIDDNSRAVSQKAFLTHLKNGQAYQAEAPTPWDVTFRTAVAQAEQEDHDREGAYHRLGFTRAASSRVCRARRASRR